MWLEIFKLVLLKIEWQVSPTHIVVHTFIFVCLSCNPTYKQIAGYTKLTLIENILKLEAFRYKNQ